MTGWGWQVFSTNGAHGYDLHHRCIDSWQGYYDEMFCWLNGDVCDPRLRKYLIDTSSLCIHTNKTYTKIPWGKIIRETPLKIAFLLKDFAGVPFDLPDYIMQFDSDEHLPVHPGFAEYFNSWLKSESPAMLCNWVYPWGNDSMIRIDPFASQLSHGFFFRTFKNKRWSWLPYRGRGCPKLIKPRNCWECPYPVLHYSHITEGVRKEYVAHKRDAYTVLSLPDVKRPSHYRVHPDRVVLSPMRSDLTVKEVLAMQDDIKKGRLPNGCYEEKSQT